MGADYPSGCSWAPCLRLEPAPPSSCSGCGTDHDVGSPRAVPGRTLNPIQLIRLLGQVMKGRMTPAEMGGRSPMAVSSDKTVH